MDALPRVRDFRPILATGALLGALGALMLTPTHRSAIVLAGLLVIAVALGYGHRWLLAWPQLVGLLVLVILFIPIQRYVMAGGLPFQLEPYRVLVAMMLLGWFAALLIDPRVRFRTSGLELPIALILLGSVASDAANAGRIGSLGVQAEVIKSLMFLSSFFLILYLIVGVTKTRADVERMVEVLCAGGGVLGIFAIVEYRTQFNVFDHLQGVLPFLTPFSSENLAIGRGGEVRVFASAQHPIALGGLFAMLVPLAIYLATRPGKRLWWIPATAVLIGAVSSVSRTSMLMFAGAGIVYVWQRPRETVKAWPLIVPAVLVIQFAVPGALRSIQASFFPRGGLIAEQTAHANYTNKNRLSRWGPTLKEWARDPLVGEGFSTRQPALHPDTFVLDDQWLKTFVETGILGTLGWVLLFGRSLGSLARLARGRIENDGWLEVALGASISSFALGMWFYDAFSFIQVTVILFVLIALSTVLVRSEEPSRQQAGASTLVPRLGAGD
jgi:hypothetical protein